MFVQLQCCQKCFMHKQFNHNEWIFHDNFCKLDQTIQRKCKLRTLKNLKLPNGVMQELECYDFGELQIVDKIIDQQKEKIKPQIESFEIKYKGIYIFSLHQSKNFPDYNLIAKILLILKKADLNELILLNKQIKIAGLASLYELVKEKYHYTSEKNIKIKSIQELIPQKQFRRTQISTLKDKRATHNSSSHQQLQVLKTINDPTSFEEFLFKQRQQNHYVFKRKDSSNTLIKPSTAQCGKSIGRGSEKVSGRGSANMSLPKISAEQLAAKKRQLKRIRCKKFSNRYLSMNKKSQIINKLVKSEYGRIKQEKYEFLSKESDLKVDEQFNQQFSLQELSDSSDQQENIFRNCSNFTRSNCLQLLNELCKADEHRRKCSQVQTSNVPYIESTHSINKKQLDQSNEFGYEYDSGQKLGYLEQYEFNISSLKSRMQFSENNLLEAIRETEDEKCQNNSFNYSGINDRNLAEKRSADDDVGLLKQSLGMGKIISRSKQCQNVTFKGQKNKEIVENVNVLNLEEENLEEENLEEENLDEKKLIEKEKGMELLNQIEQSSLLNEQTQILQSQKDEQINCQKEQILNDCIQSSSQRQQSQQLIELQCYHINEQAQDSNESLTIEQKQAQIIDHEQTNIEFNNTTNEPSSTISQINNPINNQPQTQNKLNPSLNNEQNITYPQSTPIRDLTNYDRLTFESRQSQTESDVNKQDKKTERYPWQEETPRQSFKCEQTLLQQNKLSQSSTVNNTQPQPTQEYSLFHNYFSSHLQNFPQKISSFKTINQSNIHTLNPSSIHHIQHFLNFIYPCPKILLQTRSKKKISKIIQNFIDPYLEQLEQSQQQKQWVQLTQTNVCKIFLLPSNDLPKKVQTILWNRINHLDTKLYVTKPQDEFQSFIELGQLHKQYKQVLFLFYHHAFQLHHLPFEINQKNSTKDLRQHDIRQHDIRQQDIRQQDIRQQDIRQQDIRQQDIRQQKRSKKYSFQLNIGQKYVSQSQQANNEPNHIFIAFQAKNDSTQDEKQKPTKQLQQKLKSLNMDISNELNVKIEVYQNQNNKQKTEQNKQHTKQELIGTIEKKGKFFFELNLQKGQYKFQITISCVDLNEELRNKQVELLFYSQAEVKTSHIKEVLG